MNAGTYLARIAYEGELGPSSATLRALHRQHLFTVPFENLDIPLGTPIKLELPLLYDKIVTRGRGGFCYELNGLFCWLLAELGFQVQMLAAGVRSGDGGFGPEFDHMLLKIEVEGTWLADVGFGESFVNPIRLAEGAEDRANGKRYFLAQDGGEWLLVREEQQGDVPQYRFRDVPHEVGEYSAMCDYHQYSPLSHFTQSWICSKATPEGRITLANWKLIISQGAERQEVPLASEAELRGALRDYFGIALPAAADLSRLL